MKTETENSQNENINIEEPAVEEKTAKRPGRPRRKTTDKPATVRKTAARSTKKKEDAPLGKGLKIIPLDRKSVV